MTRILVSAHPDDEIIWFNPEKFDKIMICFSDRLDSYQTFLARKRAAKRHPFKDRIEYLNLTESGYHFDKSKLPEYEKNREELRELLKDKLVADEIYTHDPQTGEYGHADHILVGEVVKELAKCPVYSLDMTADKDTPDRIAMEANQDLFLQIRRIYKEEGCWTWYGEFYPRGILYYKKIN